MARPTARVLTLLELLQSSGTRTVAELAGQLGVDERTVRRYVQHLLELDVPVISVRGRYGGYRLAPGYRMPPLMLNDEEALAVLLGLVAGRRAGLMTSTGVASETAAAKVRRVLPERLGRGLDAVLDSLAFTDPGAPAAQAAPPDTPGTPERPSTPTGPGAQDPDPAGLSTPLSATPAAPPPAPPTAPRSDVLLPLADAVRHHRPVRLRYASATGRHSERTLHPYGLVTHAGRWYVTGADPAIGEDRMFRLDRVLDARTLPGSFAPPTEPGPGPGERVLTALATAPYAHEVSLRIQGTAEQIRPRLPAALATLTPIPSAKGGEQDAQQGWLRAELRVERLNWLPAVLASLDRPFVIERPAELRSLVVDFAERLARSARPPDHEGRS
ncbi:WYL domain-containing protein [Streptomyces sp. NPDC006660]|uniref:helix-turn-helix transcriptional regulator n=1 Tax=Streptomyces sp. NPDC006660 TaxID=3156901 RepID=UPI0033ED8E2C